MAETKTCEICGKKTEGENTNYCMNCGSSFKGLRTKQKLVVIQEIDLSLEELNELFGKKLRRD